MILQFQVWSFLLLQEAAVNFDLRSMWSQMGWLAKVVVIVLFIMSAWSIGVMIDRLIRVRPHWRATVPAIACFLVVPVELAFLLSNSRAVWVAAFAASAFLVLVHQGPLFAMVMSVTRLRMRAMAVSILVLCSALLGQASGPAIIGALNDGLAPSLGPNAIRFSLLVIVASAFAAGLCLLAAGRFLDADIARAQAPAE